VRSTLKKKNNGLPLCQNNVNGVYKHLTRNNFIINFNTDIKVLLRFIIIMYLYRICKMVRGDQEGLFKLVTLDRILNRITGVTSGCRC
jgi:hypothetical protein